MKTAQHANKASAIPVKECHPASVEDPQDVPDLLVSVVRERATATLAPQADLEVGVERNDFGNQSGFASSTRKNEFRSTNYTMKKSISSSCGVSQS